MLELSIVQVAMAYVFVLLVFILLRFRGIAREKELLLGTVRMTLQLILAGLVLGYLFDVPHPLLTLPVLILMEIFAIYTIFRKFKGKLNKHLKRVIVLAMSGANTLCLLYFIIIVMRVDPWYEPRYFIPVAGMLIGNSMTGISLGLQTLLQSTKDRRAHVEQALILGARPREAMRACINRSFDAAILPTLQTMMGMGIVFLPGMMTGQILSGAAPMAAISYQIAIMLGIFGSVALAVFIMTGLGYKTFFNERDQLIETIDRIKLTKS